MSICLFVCDSVVFVLYLLISSSMLVAVGVSFPSTPLVIVVCLSLGAFIEVVRVVPVGRLRMYCLGFVDLLGNWFVAL